MKKILLIVPITILFLYLGAYIYLQNNSEPNITNLAITINNIEAFTREVNYKQDFKFPFLKTEYILNSETDKKNIKVEEDIYLSPLENNDYKLVIKTEDETVYEGEPLTNLNGVIKNNGNYLFEITKTYDENPYESGYIKYSLDTYIKFPVEVAVSSDESKQGGYIKLTMTNIDETDNLKIETDLLKTTEYFIEETDAISYIPIHVNTNVGNHYIKVFNNEELLTDYSVNITKEDFDTQYLTIDQDTVNSTATTEAYSEYNKVRNDFRKNNLEEKLWEDTFIMPVEGRISTEFGAKRYTNGSESASVHSGIDIAAPKGTKIKCPATGKVIVAKKLTLTGNTIMIDHGMGLLTYYLHMDSFSVKEGDTIKQGEILGTVGSTGFSTGPHLHFTVAFNETYVNPWLFIKK